MGQYAAADADLTLRLAEHFQTKLTQQGLDYFFYDFEVMPLYKEVTITMEDKGIDLDMDLILDTKAKIQVDIDRLYKEIKEEIMSHEKFIEWRNHKALAEFPYSNKGRFASKFLELNSVPLKKTAKGSYSFTKATIEALPVEYDYYKAYLLGEITLTNEEIEQVCLSLLLEDEEYFNLNSKAQLGEIVVNYMGIRSLTTTAKGSPQFDDDMIQHLVENHKLSWAKKLSNYNKLIKIKGTYIDRFLDEQEDGKYYPSFFQHRTISGRYGSNLQQLSRVKEEGELDPIVLKYNNVIRSFFISGEDRIFVDNDYESLEPHVFAHVSGDQKLKDIFLKGHDFYSTIAIATEKLEGVSADKKADNYLGKVNKPKRQASKAYSLGVPYGMQGYALGKTLDISTEEAEKLIEGYLNGFPDLKRWMEQSENTVKIFGEIKTETGRSRHLYKVKELYSKHKDNLLDYKYRASLSKRFGKEQVQQWYMDYKNGLNNAKNIQIQGLSASIMNLAMIEINKELKKRKIDGWVALTVHDQAVVNVPEDRAEECKELVQNIMENNYKISIPLKAPAALGRNLKESH
jgi:DNA polymerase I-like protein with 3'-5' exonuclease and polymerase domains